MNRIRIREYFERYTYNVGISGVRTLTDCYSKPSNTKVSIWQGHKDRNPNARYMSVITFNCTVFSMGWVEKENGSDNLYFRVETKGDSGKLLLGPNEKIELRRAGILWQ